MKNHLRIYAILIFTCGMFTYPTFAQVETAEFLYKQGVAEFKKNNYLAAAEFYSKAISLKPDYFEAYRARGTAHSFNKDYEKAIADFIKANEIKPGDLGVLINRASAYTQIKDYKNALADLNQALTTNPDSAEALGNRAGVFRRQKDYKSAIEDYTRALKIRQHYSAYQGRCFANYDAGNFEAAAADCTEAINLNPQIAPSYFYRGRARAKIGQNVLAANDFRKALDIDPNLPGAKTELDKLSKTGTN